MKHGTEDILGSASVIVVVTVKALDLQHGCRFRRGTRKNHIAFGLWDRVHCARPHFLLRDIGN